MKKIIRTTLTFLFATLVASIAIAQPGDATYGNIVRGQARVSLLEYQLNSMGVETNYHDHAAISPDEKAAMINERADDLALQLKILKSQRSE